MTAKEKILQARTGLILDSPFFASLALRQELIEDSSIETMQTNGERIRYNPDFVNSLRIPQLKGVLCHEVMHCACNHHTRRGDRDPDTWNNAGDFAINPIILEEGFELPDDALNEPQFKGKPIEEIFEHLRSRPKQQPQPGEGETEESDDQGDDQDNQDTSQGDGESDSDSDGNDGDSDGDQGEGEDTSDGQGSPLSLIHI